MSGLTLCDGGGGSGTPGFARFGWPEGLLGGGRGLWKRDGAGGLMGRCFRAGRLGWMLCNGLCNLRGGECVTRL